MMTSSKLYSRITLSKFYSLRVRNGSLLSFMKNLHSVSVTADQQRRHSNRRLTTSNFKSSSCLDQFKIRYLN